MERSNGLARLLFILTLLSSSLALWGVPGNAEAASVNCVNRGQTINPNSGQAESIGAGVWFAGVEYASSFQRRVGSNITSTETSFNFALQPGGFPLGTKGFCGGNSAAEAQLTAVEIVEGELFTARGEDGNREISLYGKLVHPVDERTVNLSLLDPEASQIQVGDVVTLAIFCEWSTRCAGKWGDGQSFDLGYQAGGQNLTHIYATPGSKLIEVANSSDKFVRLAINVQDAPTPEILTGSIGTDKGTYTEGELVTAIFATSIDADVCVVWRPGVEFCPRTTGGQTQTSQHVFPAGTRSATIELRGPNRELLDSASITITPPTQTPPTITIEAPAMVKHGEVVTATLTAGQGNVNFVGRLHFGDGQDTGVIAIQPGQSVGFPHVFANSGNQPQQRLMEVRDQQGTTVASKAITVLPAATPVPATATVTHSPIRPKSGQIVTFAVKASQGEADFVGSLDFGDGSDTGLFNVKPGQTLSITHAYDIDANAQPGQGGCQPRTYAYSLNTAEVASLSMAALAEGATITVDPAICRTFLPVVHGISHVVNATAEVLTRYPDGGVKVRFTLTSNGNFGVTTDFGDGENTGLRGMRPNVPDVFEHDFRPGIWKVQAKSADGVVLWEHTVIAAR